MVQVMLWAERKRAVPLVREDEDDQPHVDEHDEGGGDVTWIE